MEDDPDADEFVCEYKSRNNRKHYRPNGIKTGHTYRHLKVRDQLRNNALCYVNVKNNLQDDDERKFDHNQFNLLLHTRKEDTNRSPLGELDYSLNKKNRWKLIDLVQQRAHELPYSSQKTDDENKVSFSIVGKFNNRAARKTQNHQWVRRYFDNNKFKVGFKSKLDDRYYERVLYPDSAKIKNSHHRGKGKKQPIKRGNWLLLSHKKTATEDPQLSANRQFLTASTIEYTFHMPVRIYKFAQIWRFSLRNFPDYGSKLIKRHFFNYNSRNVIKHMEKNKKVRSLRDFINYEHQSDKVPCVDEIVDRRGISHLHPRAYRVPIKNLICPVGQVVKSRPSLLIERPSYKEKMVVIEPNDVQSPVEPTPSVISGPSRSPDSNMGLFKKFTFTIGGDKSAWLESVERFIDSNCIQSTSTIDGRFTVNLISRPTTVTFVRAFLVYQLSEADSFTLNMDVNRPTRPNSNLSLQFADFQHLIDYVVKHINRLIESLPGSDVNPSQVCGEKATFTDVDTLRRQNEILLNRCETTPKPGIELEAMRTEVCDVCYDELEWPREFWQSGCGHVACVNCWQMYLTTAIKSMKGSGSFEKESQPVKRIRCLCEKCNYELTLEQMYQLIPAGLVSKYVQFYTELCIVRERDKYAQCANLKQKCEKVILIRLAEPGAIRKCQCGYEICKYCLCDNHFPSLCVQAKIYLTNLKKIEQLKLNGQDLYTSEGKNCPNCGNYMEKNAGCNHMSCTCGFQFCWLCLQDFYRFHNASDGFHCKHEKKDTIVYGPERFVSIKFDRLEIRKELAFIMTEQRNGRVDFVNNLNRKLFSISERLQNRTIKHDLDLPELNGRVDLKSVLDEAKQKFIELHRIIEYLALLVSNPNRVFLKGAYSFKRNAYNSLKRALCLKGIVVNRLNLKINNANCVDCFKLVLFYSRVVSQFILNMNHFAVHLLKIYNQCK